MKFENYMTLEFPSRSNNEAFARSAVSCFAAQLDPTMEELGEILEVRQDIYDETKKYIAHSLHFSCEVEDVLCETAMTESEKQRGFQLAWADIDTIIETNERILTEKWQLRDVEFLKWYKANYM